MHDLICEDTGCLTVEYLTRMESAWVVTKYHQCGLLISLRIIHVVPLGPTPKGAPRIFASGTTKDGLRRSAQEALVATG
jgi:hypothetical protein